MIAGQPVPVLVPVGEERFLCRMSCGEAGGCLLPFGSLCSTCLETLLRILSLLDAFYCPIGLCEAVGWSVGWLCASVPSQPCAGGGLGDLPWRQLVPREGDQHGQASAQRASPGLALDLSIFQPVRVIAQHLGLWVSSSQPAKPGVHPLLPRFHTLFVDF